MLHLDVHDATNIDVVVSDFITSNKEWNFPLLNSFLLNDTAI